MKGIKTTVDKIWFCRAQRVPSKRYKANYDKIKWDNIPNKGYRCVKSRILTKQYSQGGI